jgi:hypothetical protein
VRRGWGADTVQRYPARKYADLSAHTLPEDVASNHSPRFAPVIDPTLQTGVRASLAATACWNTAQQPPR